MARSLKNTTPYMADPGTIPFSGALDPTIYMVLDFNPSEGDAIELVVQSKFGSHTHNPFIESIHYGVPVNDGADLLIAIHGVDITLIGLGALIDPGYFFKG